MNKAEPLMSVLRQLAVAKTTTRAGAPNTATAHDRKDSADRFHDQLRLVAQGAKIGTKAESKTDVNRLRNQSVQDTKHLEREPVATGEAAPDPTTRVGKSKEKSSPKAKPDAEPARTEWHGEAASLSALISRLDQAQAQSVTDNDTTTAGEARLSSAIARPESHDALDFVAPTQPPKTEPATEQRFALSIDSAHTRPPTPIKVAVRDQETHFQPVQQVSLLQKIVDRLAPNLPTAPAVTASTPAAALPDLPKAVDAPVKVLTLQLDPPDLGAVTVKMRLAGDAVEIRMTAERHETAQMLQHERGTLTEAMQSAGYKFDIASIDQSKPGDAAANGGQQQPQPDQRQSQASGGAAQFDSASADRQPGDAAAGSRQNRHQHEQPTERPERPQDNDRVSDRRSGIVYL